MRLLLLVVKNLSRNKVRSALTALAVVCLVVIFSMIATVLQFLDRAMQARETDVPVVITERYRIPSRFPYSYFANITQEGRSPNTELRQLPGFDPEKYNLWHFIGFSTDMEMKDKNLFFFCIATLPEKIPTMVDGLEGFDRAKCELLRNPPISRRANSGVLMGPDRLKKIGKKVGDNFKAKSISHRTGTGQQLEMEFEVVGELPGDSRWADGAFIDYAYVDRVLKKEKSDLDGKINLGWLRLADQASAAEAGRLIEQNNPDIKCEVASAAVSRFLESYKDLLNGVKFVLAPAIVVVMIVIIANAISITVRERTAEMAVLKVLGFRPGHILFLVLGEGILLGLVAGAVGAAATYGVINHYLGGIKIPIGFFPVFFVPVDVFWWGPVLGAVTAFLGAIAPSLSARSIKVTEVFARVA